MNREPSVFWQRYAGGLLASLRAFSQAVRAERTSYDSPDTTTDRFFERQVDGIIFDAPIRLRFPSMFLSETYLKQGARADWQHVDPRLMLFAARLVEACRKQGIPLFVHSAFRTKEQQDLEVAQGDSQTLWPRAAHCQGKAVDIVHSKFAWELTEMEWRLIVKIGNDIAAKMATPYKPPTDYRPAIPAFQIVSGANVRYGGSWKKQHDPAHWEIASWREEPIRHLATGPRVELTPRAILKMHPNR